MKKKKRLILCGLCSNKDDKETWRPAEFNLKSPVDGAALCFDCFCYDICHNITRNVFEGESFQKAFNREVPRTMRKRVLAAYEFPLKKQVENAIFFLEDKFNDLLGDWEFRIR